VERLPPNLKDDSHISIEFRCKFIDSDKIFLSHLFQICGDTALQSVCDYRNIKPLVGQQLGLVVPRITD
jgi:hypothetical protein